MLTEAQNKFLEELYKSTFNLLKIYAISAVGDNPQAEELVQDTFTVACNKIEKLEESPNKIGWLLL